MTKGRIQGDDVRPSAPGDAGSRWPSARAATSLLRPFAVLVLLALLVAQAIAPSLQGLGVGLDPWVERVRTAGALLSHLTLMGAMVLAAGGTMALLRSDARLPTRLGALSLGGFVAIVALSSVRLPVTTFSQVLVGTSASLVGVLAAIEIFRAPFARVAGIVVLASSLASLLRIGAFALLYLVSAEASSGFARASAFVAALAQIFGAVGVLVALGWLAARRRASMSLVVVAIFVIAFFLTRQIAGPRDWVEAPAALLLLRRSVERLLAPPEPALPLFVQQLLALLTPLTALALVAARGLAPALAAAAALALLVRGSSETPLGALVFVAAAVGAALASRDPRGFWDALAPARRTEGARAGEAEGPLRREPELARDGEDGSAAGNEAESARQGSRDAERDAEPSAESAAESGAPRGEASPRPAEGGAAEEAGPRDDGSPVEGRPVS